MLAYKVCLNSGSTVRERGRAGSARRSAGGNGRGEVPVDVDLVVELLAFWTSDARDDNRTQSILDSRGGDSHSPAGGGDLHSTAL